MSTEPSPPPRPVPPAGGRMMGPSGLEQVTKGAARTQAAAQSLFPGMQLARAVRAIRHPSAHGLTEEQEAVARSLRQQSDAATEEVARRAPPGEWEGAQSFAALWYADRLGGHPLAEQRPPQHEENPDHLFLAAAELLDREPEALGSRESGAAARDQLHRWQMDLQAGRRWKEGAFQAVLPRNWSPARSDPAQTEQFAQASHWRDWLDGACIPPSGASPTILNRMKVWPKLPDLLRNVPTGIPIRFVIRTDQASRHAVYVVLENDPDDPQAMFLEIWNTGWGSVPAGSDRIHPAVRLHLENRLDAARALLALDAAEHVLHENLPLIKVLASLTCPGSQLERVKAGKEGTQQVLEMAAESGRLTYPAGEPVKAQRSGSCVAKGLRQWMQHALGGSHNSEGRRLMALLDLVASSVLAVEYPPQQADSEIRELRRWLAGITAGYRWWKAVSRETDPQELLLRSAATRAPRLSAQRTAAATEQVYQPSAFTSPAAEALQSGAPQELDPGLRLDRICARLRSLAIQGDFLELEELWKVIELWRDHNPAQFLARATYEDNVKGPTNKAECWTPDIVECQRPRHEGRSLHTPPSVLSS
jgi:hypothetical protein